MLKEEAEAEIGSKAVFARITTTFVSVKRKEHEVKR